MVAEKVVEGGKTVMVADQKWIGNSAKEGLMVGLKMKKILKNKTTEKRYPAPTAETKHT